MSEILQPLAGLKSTRDYAVPFNLTPQEQARWLLYPELSKVVLAAEPLALQHRRWLDFQGKNRCHSVELCSLCALLDARDALCTEVSRICTRVGEFCDGEQDDG